MGSLHFSEGYQIKMIEEVTDFQFCESYAGWIAPVYGCTGPNHCNFNALANTDDGSCVSAQEGYDCDGNIILHIGDLHAGGIVTINEDGTGLVADLQDLEENMGGMMLLVQQKILRRKATKIGIFQV